MAPRLFERPAAAAAVAAAALAAGGAGGAAGYALLADSPAAAPTAAAVASEPAPSGSSAAKPASLKRAQALTIADIAKQSTPGVVEILVTSAGTARTSLSPFGRQSAQSEGSGFVLDTAGNIVTNQHVVDGATAIRVSFANGREADAKVVGTDPSTDLAVIKVADVPAAELKPLALGDSSALAVGDGVVAIGAPFGLEGTVTAGIVSALGRDITSPNGYPISGTIQTDAAINHGNSGGPLLNDQGKVVGVNAQIQSDGGGSDGVGFAIPAATVQQIASQLIASGKVQHAYLGARITTISQRAATALGVPRGVLIAAVSSSGPAATAGLKAGTTAKTVDGSRYASDGDIITAADGKAVLTTDDLRAAIDAKKPGDTISFTVSRAGESRTVTVTLGTRPS